MNTCRDDCYLCHPDVPLEWWAFADKRRDVRLKARASYELLKSADPSSPEAFAARLRDAMLNLSDILAIVE